jgi:cytidylate kinase
MIAMEDKVYKNMFAVKAALGMLQAAKKAEKLDRAAELEKLKPEAAAYKASKEYEKLMEDIKKRDEEDEFRTDADP